MADANSSLITHEADVDGLMEAHKAFIRSQSRYKDYDYEGSTMSIILRQMAYNTYLNLFYHNMVSREAFLDSAQQRDSVVSRAKELNYVPRGYRSSRTTADVRVSGTGVPDGNLEMRKGTIFTGSNGVRDLSFVTDRDRVVHSSNGLFLFADVELFEGSYLNESYVWDRSREDKRLVISNERVDVDSLSVTVAENGSERDFLRANTMLGLTESSEVFFVQGAADGRFEIEMGDDVIGREPADGATVVVSYRVSAGSEGDGVETLTLSDDVVRLAGGVNSEFPVVTLRGPSSDGGDPEDAESVRRRAPRWFPVQEAAVRAADYEAIVLREFPQVDRAYVYGGEQVTTGVEYGRVFVVPVSSSGDPLPDLTKDRIRSVLQRMAPLGITVSVTDPEYLRIEVSVRAKVDLRRTPLSPAQVVTRIRSAVLRYDRDELGRFDAPFSSARVLRAVIDSDPSVVTAELSVIAKKEVDVSLGEEQSYTVHLNNELSSGVRSSEFLSEGRQCYLTDSPPGRDPGARLWLVDVKSGVQTEAGTVDLVRGVIQLSTIRIDDLLGSEGLAFRARTVSADVWARRNDVVEVETSDLSVSVEEV